MLMEELYEELHNDMQRLTLRPDSTTHARLCEAYIRLRAARPALAELQVGCGRGRCVYVGGSGLAAGGGWSGEGLGGGSGCAAGVWGGAERGGGCSG